MLKNTVQLQFTTVEQAIKYLRDVKNLSQNDLAEMTGISARRIQYVEQKCSEYTVKEFLSLAIILCYKFDIHNYFTKENFSKDTPPDIYTTILADLAADAQRYKDKALERCIEATRGLHGRINIIHPEYLREDMERHVIEEQEEIALLNRIKDAENSLSKMGYVFYPKRPHERLEEIKEYYSTTKLDLSDFGINKALISVAIDDSFI